MKKFTLSAFACCGFLIATATGAPKTLRAKAPVIQPETVPAVTAEKKAAYLISDVTTSVGKAINKDAVKKQAPARAGEASDITVLYTYPDGAYFPLTTFSAISSTDQQLHNYFSRRNATLISAGKVLFPNYSFTVDADSKIVFPENEDWNWAYNVGDYFDFIAAKTSSDYELNALFTPCSVLNNPMQAPVLSVGDNSYPKEIDDDLPNVIVGGNGSWNPGFEQAQIEYGGYQNIAHTSLLYDYNTAESYQEMVDPFMAGNDKTLFQGGITPDEIRTDALSRFLTAQEVDPNTFFGFGQFFYTGSTETILSYIRLRAYLKGEVGDEITFTLYKVEELADGSSMFENVTEGYYEITDEGLYIDIIDIETTGEDTPYITLEPNSTYMIAISGIENLGCFIPDVFKYTMNVDNYIPEYFMRNRACALYATDKGLALISTALNYRSDVENCIDLFPSISFQMGVTLPYITPVAAFTSASGSPLALDPEDTECDITFFNIEGLNIPVSHAIIQSDATLEALTASIEYSSPELKDQVTVRLVKDDPTSQGQVNWESSVYNVLFYVNSSIPANSYVTIKNYGNTFKFNLPAYEMSGIGDVVADGEAVATEYFDLQGRKLAGEANGIVIKKMTMADGSVKAVKVVK